MSALKFWDEIDLRVCRMASVNAEVTGCVIRVKEYEMKLDAKLYMLPS